MSILSLIYGIMGVFIVILTIMSILGICYLAIQSIVGLVFRKHPDAIADLGFSYRKNQGRAELEHEGYLHRLDKKF